MEKRWITPAVADAQKTDHLSSVLNIDKKLASILVNRGIYTYEDAHAFFRPSLSQLHDPFLMKDMDRAVARINQAIARQEKILVFGDYDVDGTTAVALMYSFLTTFYPNTDFYIPDRYTEGYGISFKGIDYAHDNDITLIISLDCGIKSIDKVEYAKARGIDFIICDHHLPGKELPDAIVLDPKREDCAYLYKELSGCGVGFKLCQAWSMQQNISPDLLFSKLDLVAISIAADIVPITGENRILACHGLKIINTSPSIGVKTILEVAGKTTPVDITDLVFIVGPRINAAGRMTTGRNAVEMLISTDDTRAIEFAGLINDNNLERKTIDKQITEHALTKIAADETLKKAKTTVLFDETWHKGVIGIVASRLTEHYYRPTILLTASNGKATGSARSVRDFDVYEAIEACSHLLEQFGGHKYAAGLTLKVENIEAFRQQFEEVVSRRITEEHLIPSLQIDEEIDFDVLNVKSGESFPKFYRILKQLAPFGPGNLSPLFIARKVSFDLSTTRVVGDAHLKLTVFQKSNPGLKLSGIGFSLAKHYPVIEKGNEFDILFALEENEWNGNISLQLNVKDIKPFIV